MKVEAADYCETLVTCTRQHDATPQVILLIVVNFIIDRTAGIGYDTDARWKQLFVVTFQALNFLPVSSSL